VFYGRETVLLRLSPPKEEDLDPQVGSRRGVECGAVDDAQHVDAEDLVVVVHDPTDLAPSVV
jgi:hypothetical protein